MQFIELSMFGYRVTSATIANVTILGVMRNGIGQTDVSTTPVGRQFKYYSTGMIEFDVNTDNSQIAVNDLLLDKIHVLYK